jgi:glycerophosphoryl diester phosphodiesterase
VLVLMHDPTLERTTNGTGPVALRTAAELRALDAGCNFTTDEGATFPFRERGVRVPLFDEVVDGLPRDLPLIIELKTAVAAPLVRDAIRRHGIADRVIVAGFEAAAVHPLRGAGFPLGATTPDVAGLLLPSLLRRRLRNLPYRALCIPPNHRGVPVPIRAIARAIQGSDTVMHIWTINDPARARGLWRLGVQGIITDDPARMLAVRAGIG